MTARNLPSPNYTTNGRQLPFVESYPQKLARAEFIQLGQRASDMRVAAWVQGQRLQTESLWEGTPLAHVPRREPYIHQPHSFPAQENPISCYSVPYIHPDDEEPFIFYSTSPKKAVFTPEAEVIYSTPMPTPVAKPHRPKHMRHRRQPSHLGVIPEEMIVEG